MTTTTETKECPDCKRPLHSVRVYSECYQMATVHGGEITDYGNIEEITETKAIQCQHCGCDVSEIIKE